jgi:pimeloyl-ACP methyl ester carboxylesterase
MGGNILLQMATMQPDRIQAMVLVSSDHVFPGARPGDHAEGSVRKPASSRMRKRHKLGAEQIVALWEWQRGMKDIYDDMNFTPRSLARTMASTLVTYGDRDFLYLVEMAVEIYRAIHRSALWAVPNDGHGPIFGRQSPVCSTTLAFFRT